VVEIGQDTVVKKLIDEANRAGHAGIGSDLLQAFGVGMQAVNAVAKTAATVMPLITY